MALGLLLCMLCDRVCVWHAVLVNPYCYMYETASPSLGGRRRVVAVTALSTRQRAPRADDHRHVGSDLLLLHLNNEQLVIGSFEPRRCSAPPSTPSGVTVTQQLLGRRTKASQGAGNPSELARAATAID